MTKMVRAGFQIKRNGKPGKEIASKMKLKMKQIKSQVYSMQVPDDCVEWREEEECFISLTVLYPLPFWECLLSVESCESFQLSVQPLH